MMLTIRRFMAAWLLLAIASPPSASAQGTSYQLRLIGHAQVVPRGDRFGFAAWGILPDVMNRTSSRTLVLGGGVYKGDRTWIEFMAGGLLSRTERPSFELDVRYSERRLTWINLFAEAEYNFGSRKCFIQPSAIVPARIGRVRLAVGAESDVVFTPGGRLTVAGPRVAFSLPVCRRLCKDTSVITAYRIQSDGRRVVRNYVAFVF